MSEARGTVLVVLRRQADLELARRACRARGYAVEEATGGDEAARLAAERHPDLAVVDTGSAEVPASDVCRRLRKAGSPIPLLLICERPDTADVALALAAGGDDCLLRPLGTLALAGRLAAHLERAPTGANGSGGADPLAFAGFEIELARRRLRRYGHPLRLTRVEFDLLATLALRAGEVVSRSELLRLVWGYDGDVPFGLVDPRVRRLQRRLQDAGGRPVRIEMLPAQDGYRFSVPAPADHRQGRRRPVAPVSGLPDRGPKG